MGKKAQYLKKKKRRKIRRGRGGHISSTPVATAWAPMDHDTASACRLPRPHRPAPGDASWMCDWGGYHQLPRRKVSKGGDLVLLDGALPGGGARASRCQSTSVAVGSGSPAGRRQSWGLPAGRGGAGVHGRRRARWSFVGGACAVDRSRVRWGMDCAVKKLRGDGQIVSGRRRVAVRRRESRGEWRRLGASLSGRKRKHGAGGVGASGDE
jgi:hypothetical protein